MKGLTLTQPWASLVAVEAKRIETRSWHTKYRGLLAIHAAAGFSKVAQDICRKPPFSKVLAAEGIAVKALPLGAIVAVAELMDVYPTERCHTMLWLPYMTPQEFAFGDYSPGRFAWHLDRIIRLPEPIPYKGALGLWDVPADIEAKLAVICGSH